MASKKKTDTDKKPAIKPTPRPKTVSKPKKERVFSALTLTLSVALAFVSGLWLQSQFDKFGEDHGKQERVEPGTTISRFCTRERPNRPNDFPAVGEVLRDTAKRLRNGTLADLNDATADTIARIQPAVLDASEWRAFVLRLATQIQGGTAEQIATQFEEAASAFGTVRAVEDMAKAIAPPKETPKEEVKNEKPADEDAGKNSADSGGDTGDSGGKTAKNNQPGTAGKPAKSQAVRVVTPPVQSACPTCTSGSCGYYGGAW